MRPALQTTQHLSVHNLRIQFLTTSTSTHLHLHHCIIGRQHPSTAAELFLLLDIIKVSWASSPGSPICRSAFPLPCASALEQVARAALPHLSTVTITITIRRVRRGTSNFIHIYLHSVSVQCEAFRSIICTDPRRRAPLRRCYVREQRP